MPTIVVLVKHVPDSWSTRSLEDDFTLNRQGVDEVIDEINEHAMEQALRIREADPQRGWRIVALTLGPARAEAAVRKAIAMGADEGVVVTDDAVAGSDVVGTAWALNCALTTLGDVDLIVTGDASSDGKMGALPGILSEYRRIPALTHLDEVSINDTTVHGTRVTAKGTATLSAPLPAIISVTERSGKARFPNFKGIMAAKKAQLTQWGGKDIGLDPATVGLGHAATAVTAATARPERTRGTVIEGTDPKAAAAALADFLADKRLL